MIEKMKKYRNIAYAGLMSLTLAAALALIAVSNQKNNNEDFSHLRFSMHAAAGMMLQLVLDGHKFEENVDLNTGIIRELIYKNRYDDILEPLRYDADGTILDPWGNPIKIFAHAEIASYSEIAKAEEIMKFRILSYGPNGKYENGAGDDIVIELQFKDAIRNADFSTKTIKDS